MIRERVVTDHITDTDWATILSLDLKPVHKAYLEEFKRRNNEPRTLDDIWKRVGWLPSIQTNVDKKQDLVFFDQVSQALRIRKTRFRLRSATFKKYRVVVVEV